MGFLHDADKDLDQGEEDDEEDEESLQGAPPPEASVDEGEDERLLERAVWWPDLAKDVAVWVSKRSACIKGRARPTKVEARGSGGQMWRRDLLARGLRRLRGT